MGYKQYFVYMMTNRWRNVLYTGVTYSLEKRVWQHKNKVFEGFTGHYGVDQLVWYGEFGSAEAAITREKQLKKWNRAWKMRLIEEQNPTWRDLYDDIAS